MILKNNFSSRKKKKATLKKEGIPVLSTWDICLGFNQTSYFVSVDLPLGSFRIFPCMKWMFHFRLACAGRIMPFHTDGLFFFNTSIPSMICDVWATFIPLLYGNWLDL
ncbi:hypothetical protein K432DRAFT_143005 [Lepidopterella palustris CBS 459.81]|uniref:Uncharacterized protein n=1 Tax=Lepidopterella palustris CBS 459.81 TaxID=1314670 RepID=A0A8E2JKU3_9PEZI|nr:hypothetical protein K432DRAFT_143005 [Lepidopterella palustris CBS 459.81]